MAAVACMTLPLRLSIILAGTRTQDGRDVDAARTKMRDLARAQIGDAAEIDVFSCRRHGSCQVGQYTRGALGLSPVDGGLA